METPLRALLVEDSPEDAALLLRCLKRAGYAPTSTRVETAEGMHEALDRARWDIVFSDHRMPLFSALGALNLLRSRNMDLPFIIVSGNIGQEVVVAAMQAGASDYVLKDDISRVPVAVDRALKAAAERRAHRAAEEALKESEERFALAVRGSRDGLWDWNLLTGQIYYSTRFKEMLGFEEHELHDLEAFAARIHEADRELAWRALRDHMEHRALLEVELRVATKRGEYRWFSVRGQALWDDTGRAIRVAGSLNDLTARKNAEAELKAQLDLIQQQREAIQALSAPVIEVWDGVLTMPVVGALDKRTGRSQFFTMKPGETVAYGPLAIRLATCETTPPWVSPKQSGGFIQVDETVRRGGAATTVRRVFSGWLFAESPSLNAMRHPVFDVWLKSCTMSFPAGPAPRASPAPRTSPSSAKKSAPARTAEPKADT